MDQQGVQFDLPTGEDSLARRERELAERERALSQREFDFEVEKLKFADKAKELKRQGEILVRLKKLIDKRIADGQVSREAVKESFRQACDEAATGGKGARQSAASAAQTSSASKPAPRGPSPAEQPPPPKAAAQPAKSIADMTVAEKLALLKSNVAQFTKAKVPEPEPVAPPSQPPASDRQSDNSFSEAPSDDDADSTDVLFDEPTVFRNEFDLSGTRQASIFDDVEDTTVMVPEEINAMIDAELARTQAQTETPLEKHLRELAEGAAAAAVANAQRIPTPDREMSVVLADHLRFLAASLRSEDAITESQF